MKNEDFIGHIFPQNCGDSLKVISKSDKKQGSNYFYRCQFQKYPCEVLALKTSILLNKVNNPQIEIEEFVNKIHPQNCGDSLRIIKKSDIKKNGNYLWECEFIKYPYKVFSAKTTIILKQVNNPQIEQVEFIDKIWPQNCGDSLRII